MFLAFKRALKRGYDQLVYILLENPKIDPTFRCPYPRNVQKGKKKVQDFNMLEMACRYKNLVIVEKLLQDERFDEGDVNEAFKLAATGPEADIQVRIPLLP